MGHLLCQNCAMVSLNARVNDRLAYRTEYGFLQGHIVITTYRHLFV